MMRFGRFGTLDLRWVVVTSLAVAFGCGGKAADLQGNGGTGSVAPPVAQVDLPAALANSLCEGMAACCKTAGFALNVATCSSKLTADLHLPNRPNQQYDPVLGGRCVAESKSTLSSCGDVDDVAACDAMFYGTVAPGGSCTDSDECAQPEQGRALCDYSNSRDFSIGVCSLAVEPERGVVGTGCSLTCTDFGGSDGTLCIPTRAASGPPPADAATCYTNDGLYCSTASWSCQVQAKAGEFCDDSSVCVDGTNCDFTVQRCVAPGNVGAACSSSTQCIVDAYCDGVACQTKKAEGQSCHSVDECVGACIMSADSGTGACIGGNQQRLPTQQDCQRYNL